MQQRTCDGIRRRDFISVGTAGVLGAGISLPNLLQLEALAAEKNRSVADVNFIFLFLKGGLSTIDTWDMKPDAPAEFRGEFQPISTATPGVQLCEHLPQLAKETNRFALVRSFGHRNSGHGPADHYMLTGYHPAAGFNASVMPNNQRPAHGSLISRQLGPQGPVPPYVVLPRMHNSGSSSYLGAAHAPFVVEADPNSPTFAVPDLAPPMHISANRLDDRRSLFKIVNRYTNTAEARANSNARALDSFQQRAFNLMTSQATKDAFDMEREPPQVRDAYGRTSLGQSCLMARRLVEAGVRCVLVNHSNWDTHYNNFHVLQHDLLPHLDHGLSTLLRDLDERGMLETTFVVVTGEFGRTPRVNKDAGRDHWGPSTAIAVAGGGVRGGTVVGASNERAEKPATTPYGPEDLSATIFHALGIDPKTKFHTAEGRPIPIVPGNGRVIEELFA